MRGDPGRTERDPAHVLLSTNEFGGSLRPPRVNTTDDPRVGPLLPLPLLSGVTTSESLCLMS